VCCVHLGSETPQLYEQQHIRKNGASTRNKNPTTVRNGEPRQRSKGIREFKV
jgi:hypothetical protein